MPTRGIGELGICGAGTAVMNAIHNAIRRSHPRLPRTLAKLLAAVETLDG